MNMRRHISVAAACLVVTTVRADPQDIDRLSQCDRLNADYELAVQIGQPFSALVIRMLNGDGTRLFWSFNGAPVTDAPGQSCTASVPGASYTCQGLTLSLPAGSPNQALPDSEVMRIEGTPRVAGLITFHLVISPEDTAVTCERGYRLRINAAPVLTPSAPTNVRVE